MTRLTRMALRRLGYYDDGFELPSSGLLPGVPSKARSAPLRELERRGFAVMIPDWKEPTRYGVDWQITNAGRKAYQHLCRTGNLPPRDRCRRKTVLRRRDAETAMPRRKLIPYAGSEQIAA